MHKHITVFSLIIALLLSVSLPALAIPIIPDKPEIVEVKQEQIQQTQNPVKPQVPVVPSDITVYLDGKQLVFDSSPVIINGTTLVPMRTIFEALGMDVLWYDKSQTILADRGNFNVTLKIGCRYAYKNEQKITLIEPPSLINGRTMVPLRFIAEAADCTVDWNSQDSTVAISMPDTSLPALPELSTDNDPYIAFEPQNLLLPYDCYTYIPIYFKGVEGIYDLQVANQDLLVAEWDGEWEDGWVWLYVEPQAVGSTTITFILKDKNNQLLDKKEMNVSVSYSTILGTYYEGYAPAVNLGALLDLLPVGHYHGVGEDAGCDAYYYDWAKLSSDEIAAAMSQFEQELEKNNFDYVGDVSSEVDQYKILEYLNVKQGITIWVTIVGYDDGSTLLKVILFK